MTDNNPNVPPQPPYQQGPPYPQGPPPGYQPIPPAKKKKWPWIVGIIVVLFIAMVGGCVAVIGSAVESVNEESAREVTVVYQVETDSPRSGSITYTNGDMDIAQETDASLPWTKDVTVTGIMKILSLSATNGSEGGSITCSIIQDGTVISTNTSSGPYASASCSGSAK